MGLPQHGLERVGSWERFRDTRPGDFESKFLKVKDSEIKEGLRMEETRIQQQEWA